MPGDSVMVVFVDKVGSTPDDETLLALAKDADGEPTQIAAYKALIVESRTDLFASIVSRIVPVGARVVKNVGDELVIRWDGCEDRQGALTCLLALYAAWEDLRGTIRVAAHLARLQDIATGDDLADFAEQICVRSGLNAGVLAAAWPSLAVIDTDIFGLPVSAASRLAGLAPKGQFLASQELVAALGEGGSLEAKYRNGRSLLEGELPNVRIASLPVVSIRNMTQISLTAPWRVVELAPGGGCRPDNVVNESVLASAKAVQTIRLIELVSYDEQLELDAGGGDAARREAMRSLRDSVYREGVLSFFYDLLFEWSEVHHGYDITRERPTEEERPEIEWRAGAPQPWRMPLAVAFTSAPDMAVDAIIRDHLKTLNGRGWRLEPTTLRVHGTVRYPEPTFPDRGGTASPLFMVEFQMPAGEVRPDDPEAVFKDLRDAYAPPGLTPVAYGLLEGETDGIVLFEGGPNVDADQVKRLLKGRVPPGRVEHYRFVRRISAVCLYPLRLDASCLGDEWGDGRWQALRALGPTLGPGAPQ